ncbi:CDP-diacylglycerol--serine O-phosphatidyltransferase [Desulfurivibrio alkaliphilus]|uniref:CDP-diacylglycerol--serine O-phosphatidyltransferase n=1 Tax=Desulfurivibrio alkaliphilus (strain DSM 19089 / UNIQEM U267 / AHT2) TaxID=589865 RepID=D6Z0L9_DESAT|nr:CDP-diacylglycerol--serine O-phosphatidyltransferase [Desulfurivibrio alkaliphilus]ADH85248.1 CDP-diacylglycerol/serine O-phosphatidyltransferase [Desulfurivibrio alkaliphilus AHT 2]
MSNRRRRYFGRERQGGKGRISLLPSLLTTISLFSGFYAIVAAIEGQFFHSAVAIIIAGVFDGLDGRVARLTGTTSGFGKEYDSLCDLVAFGVAPAILAYQWVLHPFGRYGWLAAFLYVATTALRLARFNSQAGGEESKNFTGLPCPAAGGMIATSFLFCHFFGITGRPMDVVMLAAVYLLSYLMVSSITYLSFKKPETQRRKAFQTVVGLVLMIMVLATEPRVTLFALGLVYVLSGPLAAAYRWLKPAQPAGDEQEKEATPGEATEETAAKNIKHGG